LEQFVSGADAGFIYVSMGSSVLTAKMPDMLRHMFIRAFAQLPYRVLWKWESGESSIADLPDNVRLGRWLPQQDILGQCPVCITNIRTMSSAACGRTLIMCGSIAQCTRIWMRIPYRLVLTGAICSN
jgi:hypothetical protein